MKWEHISHCLRPPLHAFDTLMLLSQCNLVYVLVGHGNTVVTICSKFIPGALMWELAVELGTGSFILVLGLPLFSSPSVLLSCSAVVVADRQSFPCLVAFSWGRVASCVWKHLLSGGALKINSAGVIVPWLWRSSGWNTHLKWAVFFNRSLTTCIVHVQNWLAFILTHFVLELVLALIIILCYFILICYFN